MCGIAQANAALRPEGGFADARVPARARGDFKIEDVQNIQYMDVSPKQIVSVATAMIPFLEHDDAGRALMGANMQRQAVPLDRKSTRLNSSHQITSYPVFCL